MRGEQIFIQIWNMGLMASVVILAVLLVRGLLMRRFPKKYVYWMWLIVGIRLICPVAVASPVSVFNLEWLQENPTIVSDVTEKNQTKEEKRTVNSLEDQEKQQSSFEKPQEKVAESVEEIGKEKVSVQEKVDVKIDIEKGTEIESTQSKIMPQKPETGNILRMVTVIWMAGMVLLLLWNLFLYFRMKRRLHKAVLYRDNIYECDNIATPFVMGLVCPRIYIPFRLAEKEREYILKHEQYHIQRRDYIVKFVAFLITLLYWFHPLVWISYFCMIRDMEMSCDEYVLGAMDTDIRKEYSKSLLAFAMNQRKFSMNFLAFGENNTRKRVKNIMNFKKQGKWIGIVAVLVLLTVGIVCLTDANAKRNDTKGKNEQKTTIENDQTVIAEEEINGYSLKLVVKTGEIEKEELSPDNGMYKGTFALESYQEEQKQDEYLLSFMEGKKTLSFPKEFSIHLADYDGDGRKDDFSLGQKNGSSSMFYQFYTVDEDGRIVQYATSTTYGNRILSVPGEFSQKFERKDGQILHTAYDQENEKTYKNSVSIIRMVMLDDNPKAEDSVEKALREAVRSTMPQKIVEAADHGIWNKIIYGKNQTSYLLANEKDDDDVTMRLDFDYQDGKLVTYVSKEYGFVDDMPEERIDKTQAVVLVQKFAEAFLGKTIDTTEIQETKIPVKYKYEDDNYASFEDKVGNSYLVQLNHNMVVRYESAEEETDNNLVKLGFQNPQSLEWEYQYMTPVGEEQEELQRLAAKLDASHGWSKKDRKQWLKEKEQGYLISYAGNEWEVFSGGYLTYMSGETLIYLPELCKLSGKIMKENLNYVPVNLDEIKEITSATLEYQTGEEQWESQTITDAKKLKELEKLLTSAKYMPGGSGCPYGKAILKIQRKGEEDLSVGDLLALSLATDSCEAFRINGVYYDYEKGNNFQSRKKMERIFNKISWKPVA